MAMNMSNYIKEFATFEEGIIELRKMIPFVSGILGESNVEKDVVYSMMDEVKRHYPSIQNPEFPTVPAFSISAYEVGFKTSGFCSFGWKINRNKKGKVHYSFRISLLDGRNHLANFKKLEENGWTIMKYHAKEVAPKKAAPVKANLDVITEAKEVALKKADAITEAKVYEKSVPKVEKITAEK